MGIMAYALLCVTQDLYHQPYRFTVGRVWKPSGIKLPLHELPKPLAHMTVSSIPMGPLSSSFLGLPYRTLNYTS